MKNQNKIIEEIEKIFNKYGFLMDSNVKMTRYPFYENQKIEFIIYPKD